MQTGSPNEAELIDLAKAGDVSAFEALYRMHSARVHGLCIRLADSRAEAEDCVQETFITAWRRLPEFRGESRLTTWLHSIAYHEVIGHKRRDAREVRHLTAVRADSEDDSANAPIEAGLEVEDLERAIAQLPARAREAFVLQKIYGYTHDEVGQIMGITAGACKSQVHRALNLLAAALPDETAPHSNTTEDRRSR